MRGPTNSTHVTHTSAWATALAALCLPSCSELKPSFDPNIGNGAARAQLDPQVGCPDAALEQTAPSAERFEVYAEKFGGVQLLRYQVPGFENLTLSQKRLAYCLYEAAMWGRDIIYDQRDQHGLTIRKTLENIYSTYTGDRSSPEWEQLKEYCGRFWFNHGNHHHQSQDKFVPQCHFDFFVDVATKSDPRGFPLENGESLEAFLSRIKPIVFDPSVNPKLVDQRPDIDPVVASSVNFYKNVTQAEVEDFYSRYPTQGDVTMRGLNSQLVKGDDGKAHEKVWKEGGMYSPAIEKIVMWLEKAQEFAENPAQKASLEKLIRFYRTGDLTDFDSYCIAWVQDTSSKLDVISGFIETYGDPLGMRGSFESLLFCEDPQATKRIEAIASEAQWFEDHLPIRAEHKKPNVTGISARVVNLIVASGEAAPSTPIGINLPNSEWIRNKYGSKSVSFGNITDVYNQASSRGGAYGEFAYSAEVVELNNRYGALSNDLSTDLHECIGHASGQLNPGIEPLEVTLKQYALTIEEARADLVALYYIYDPKLVELGLMPNLDVGRTEYNNYITNALIRQLSSLETGKNLEEEHMQSRHLITKWAYEHGKRDNVIEFVKRDGKTYVRVNDYDMLRKLFGDLLCEIQRIKSEGNFESAKALVEEYGVVVDQDLAEEVRARTRRLNLPSDMGFVQPRLVEVREGDEVVDIMIKHCGGFAEQMIEYGRDYSALPTRN